MTFALAFEELLANQGFPPHWVTLAIPYALLKNYIKKVEYELQKLGLDPARIRSFLDPIVPSPIAFQHEFTASTDSSLIRPKLTINFQMQDFVAFEDFMAPVCRQLIEKIPDELDVGRWEPLPKPADYAHAANIPAASVQPNQPIETDEPVLASTQSNPIKYKTIEVPLVFDSEFFAKLQNDVGNLGALQAEEQMSLTFEIAQLGNKMLELSRPHRLSKDDSARWRNIFELYLDAEVFFGTRDQDHGYRASQIALEQMQWFQAELDKRHLAEQFKLRDSQAAFHRYLELNVRVLKNLQFQELNLLAISKILKRFDKKTSLGISDKFPRAIQPNKLLTGNMTKDIFCFAVAYRPVRLLCQHVFCIRCIVKIQRRSETQCPLCRADVVMDASAESLDDQMEKYLRLYSPKGVKEKQRASEIERDIEDFGPGYSHHECGIM